MRGLYIHIPFCVKKCAYCDFVSYPDCLDREKEYLSALCDEFKRYEDKQVDTVYIGGGTPTALSTDGLILLLDNIFNYFDVTDDAEITIEVNPKTADIKKLSALRLAGVNRVSIGVQSFDDEVLSAIGRIHTAQDAANCILDAKFAGFKNISVDIMFGLPNQTLESLKNTLFRAVTSGVTHISCYSLILEENTPLFESVKRGDLSLPDEDTEALMYDTVCDILKKSGFKQYEISNFAKEGFYSRHNIKYWDCEEYIGCGAAAHSYFKGKRYSNTENIDEYINSSLRQKDTVTLSTEDKMSEFMFLGLRKIDGVSLYDFQIRFGVSLESVYGDVVKKYMSLGLLRIEDGILMFTPQGIRVSNTVLCEFV